MSAILDSVLDATRIADMAAHEPTMTPRESLAQQVGRLTQELQAARDELALLRGKGQTPQSGCEFSEQTLEEATVLVEYEYLRAEEPIYDADHPGVGPGHDAEVNVLQVFINGAWIDPHDCIAEAVIERWEQNILEGME